MPNRFSLAHWQIAGLFGGLLSVAYPGAVFSQAAVAAGGVAGAAEGARDKELPADAAREVLMGVDPQDPLRLLSAVESLLRLGYPEQAMALLGREQWSAVQQEQVVLQTGTARLLQLGRSPGLDQASRDRILRWLETARRESTAPEKIRARLHAWLAADPGAARAAKQQELGPASLYHLPAAVALCQELTPPQHQRLVAWLRPLGPAVTMPMLSIWLGESSQPESSAARLARDVLASCDPLALQGQATILRGRVAEAWQRAAEYERRAHEFASATGTIWRWNNRQLTQQSVTPDVEWGWQAWQWSRLLVHGSQPTADDLACDLLINVYLDKQLSADPRPVDGTWRGWQTPLPNGAGSALRMAARHGWEGTCAAVNCGLQGGPVLALAASLEALGELPVDAQSARHVDALWKALQHPNRRVRFAALECLLARVPSIDAAGTSRLVDHLGWFAASRGETRVLVVGGPAGSALEWAGALREVGLQADVVGSALEALHTLHRAERGAAADYWAVCAATALDLGPREFERQLAHDPRTHSLPILWWQALTPPGSVELSRYEVTHQFESWGEYAPQPDSVRRLIAQLQERLGPYQVTASERADQAARALAWLELAAGQNVARVRDILQRRPGILEGQQASGSLKTAAESLLQAIETASHSAP